MKTRTERAWAVIVWAAIAFLFAAAGCSDSGSQAAAPAGTRPAPPAPGRASPAPPAPTTAAPAELTLDLGGGVTMKMVFLRAGKFTMGGGMFAREVTLSKPFYMGVYEVTQAEYEAVTGTNPSRFKGPTNPVETVSWDDAAEFCKKLSAKTGKTVRLPTSAEWEYACRAGTETAFSFGDDSSVLGDYAWHGHNSGGTTHPVGQKKPNAWGLYDMHGNVEEWCADWSDVAFTKGPVTDPTGPKTGDARVHRGGSYSNSGADAYRCARSELGFPTTGIFTRGFRCVAALP